MPKSPRRLAAGGISNYTVQMGITEDKRTLVVKRQFYFGAGANLLYPVGSYDSIKGLFDRLQQNDEHTITLKTSEAN